MQSTATQFAIALLLTAAGLTTIYLAWRGRKRNIALLLLGWGLLALSYPFWSSAGGIDVGPAVGTTLAMLIAIAFVLANGRYALGSKRQRKNTRKDRAGAASPLDATRAAASGSALETTLRILAAGPIAFVAACLLSLLIVAFLQWPEADRIVIAACTMVLLWAAAMVWTCTADSPRRPLAAFGVVTLASAALLQLAT